MSEVRLIDANALLERMGLTDAVKYGNESADRRHRSYSTWMSYEIADEINDMDTIPAEVVRHARWVGVEYPDIDDYGAHVTRSFSECSQCSKRVFFNFQRTTFCPNCGARMDQENGGGRDG